MTAPPPASAPAEHAVAHLDFTVRIVRTDADLLKAVQVRHQAYSRHKPELAAQLQRPEPDDTADDCFVLLAERKLDQVPLGTMRVQVNDHRPLPMERQVALPRCMAGKRLADARRLGIAQCAAGTEVRTALFKAYFLGLQNLRVDWSVVGARPPLTRMYERLMFADVLNGATYVPDPLPNDPHRVLAFEMATAEQKWTAARHPLTNYMVHTVHPDIDIGDVDPVL